MESTIKFRDTSLPEYKEEEAIHALYQNLNAALEHDIEVMENESIQRKIKHFEIDSHYSEQITIIVNGIVHGFYLGGPQAEGMNQFIENICCENGYDIPGSSDTSKLSAEALFERLENRIKCECHLVHAVASNESSINAKALTNEQNKELDEHFKAIANIYSSTFRFTNK